MSMTFADDLPNAINTQPGPYDDWIAQHFPKLLSRYHDDVVVEMDRLVELAGLQVPQSSTAREFLGYLVAEYGASPDPESSYMAQVAAQAMVRLSYDKFLREDIYPGIRIALATPSLPGELRLVVLDALEAFAHDREFREDNRKDLAEIVFKALRTEFERWQVRRDQRYQMRLLFLIKMIGGADAVPWLDAISDAGDSEEIRGLARQTSRYVLQSLERVWSETREDQVSLPQNRARRLEEAGTLGLNEGEMVQCIFSQMKGVLIESEEDPRVFWLEHYMRDQSARIRLAAAFALAMSAVVETMYPAASLAIDLLSNFAVNCDTPGDINDAFLALKRLSERSPAVRAAIEMAQQKASEEFVRRSGEGV
jgi:hypothetical protein